MAKFPRSNRKRFQIQRGDICHPWEVWGFHLGEWTVLHTFSYKSQAKKWIAEQYANIRAYKRVRGY